MIHYRSVDNLNNTIKSKLRLLPSDIDIVVGVPRSGMLAASLVALYRNLSLADLDGFLAGKLMGGGERLRRCGEIRRVLVIDDSVHSGSAIDKAKARIEQMNAEFDVVYCCVYVAPMSREKVDIYMEVCPVPRVFEWNLMHHPILENSCVDIDGVLCIDPTQTENDDGPKYREFLSNVNALVRPTVEIKALVTCRLEKYRDLTVEWLSNNDIRYKHLFMMNYRTKEERIADKKYAKFKAKIYKKTKTVLFIESSYMQAVEISRLTNKSVFCTERSVMITEKNLLSRVLIATKELLTPKSGGSF